MTTTASEHPISVLASLLLVSAIVLGKWKLARAHPGAAVLIIGGLVFMASTPARAE